MVIIIEFGSENHASLWAKNDWRYSEYVNMYHSDKAFIFQNQECLASLGISINLGNQFWKKMYDKFAYLDMIAWFHTYRMLFQLSVP